MKLCKDCKHCKPFINVEYKRKYLIFFERKPYEDYGFAKCLADKSSRIDLVSGQKTNTGCIYCETSRDDSGDCGKEAKYFEPKNAC